jgi:polyhydroxybutyrate depolymerase
MLMPCRKAAYLWAAIFSSILLLLSVSCVAGRETQTLRGKPVSGSISKEESGPVTGPGFYARSISVDGLDRFYSFYIPTSYAGKTPIPVVLNFHGGGGNSKTQRTISTMDTTAEQHGFIVVYPQGTNKGAFLRNGYTWNAGSCCGWAQEHRVDDVKFTRVLLDALAREVPIDSRRVYATGISNGAMMCYRLACELADRIAAIAPISGPMGMGACTPVRPISILHIHGTADQFAPYAGGVGSRSLPGQNFESVKNTISMWQRALGLEHVTPLIRQITPSVTEEAYRTDKVELILCRIQGGGHTWPGGQFGFLGERVLGKMDTTISASELMWNFFKRHSLP